MSNKIDPAMARVPKNEDFLAEIAHQLRKALEDRDNLARQRGKRYTRVDAARDLKVSRASLQFYLAGAHTPSGDVLRRAIEIWGLELHYRGRKLTMIDLEPAFKPQSKREARLPIQLSLWDSIRGLQNDSLSIRVEKKGPQSITLQVEIGFKAG
jgi:hypothetical protein